MTILRSSANILMACYSSLVRLYEVELPGRSENISPSIWLKNISSAGWPFEGLQLDLLKLECWNFNKVIRSFFAKNHLLLIFLAKPTKSLLRSASFINVSVGEEPNPFPKTLTSKSVNTLWLRLNTSVQKHICWRPLLSVLVTSSSCVTHFISFLTGIPVKIDQTIYYRRYRSRLIFSYFVV